MARAISSLPTPDSPSISTGMFDLAARSARRMVRAMLSTLVTTSRNVSSPSRRRVARLQLVLERVDAQRVLDRHLQPLGPDRLDDEIVGAGAHRRDHRLDRAVRGLDDGGNGDAALAHAGEHAHAVEVGHHQIEHDRDRPAAGRPPRAAPAPLRRFRRFRPRSRSAASSPRAAGAGSDRRRLRESGRP